MNYFQLIQNLCYTAGVAEDPPIFFNDTDEETIKYKQHINQALAEIFAEEWNFRKDILIFSTIPDQAFYDMPAGIIEKKGIKIDGVTYPLPNEQDPYSLIAQSG